MKKTSLLIFILLFLAACGSKYVTKNVNQQNGFYFWKTSVSFDRGMYDQLDSFETKVIYLRLFDVGWNKDLNGAVPLGELGFYSLPESPYKKYEVVPTIFITNETFKNIDVKDIEPLANRIYKKILAHFVEVATAETYNEYNYNDLPYFQTSRDFKELVYKDSVSRMYFEKVKEIQFDCDWTETTKDKYFRFLEIMKEKLTGKSISSTIRLYQYKYPDKAGVPPVDKGMLMCYNVGDVRQVESGNSIFDKKEAFKYLKPQTKYPLKLDYAFPIFEWCAVYRNHKLIQLFSTDYFYFNTQQHKDISKNGIKKYQVIEDYESWGSNLSLKKGDIIKIESINYDDVINVASYISSINVNDDPRIVLFDYDAKSVRKNEKSIKKIFDCF
jgi:hypothetical protein